MVSLLHSCSVSGEHYAICVSCEEGATCVKILQSMLCEDFTTCSNYVVTSIIFISYFSSSSNFIHKGIAS